ncbi:MAG: SDR family NAD(P)-dependent oxidoreductase [Magnetococcus sp. WYHC-3]
MTASRRFSHQDQLDFAALSGDANPLHVDAVMARRSHVGSQVVHGVHLLLWGLEQILSREGGEMSLAAVKVRFVKPVELERPVALHSVEITPGAARWQLLGSGDGQVLQAEVLWQPLSQEGLVKAGEAGLFPGVAPGVAMDRDLSSCAGWSHALALPLDCEAARRMFPVLMSRLPAWQVALLLATTRVVGMECPGLYSLYSELNLDPMPACWPAEGFQVRCSSVRAALSLVTLELTGGGMQGRIRAFRRQPPVGQASFAALAHAVPRGRFAARRVLLVGGSRGLGEVAAKLLAAGGARVCLTWRLGQQDARRVVDEINSGGGDATALSLDVNDPESLKSLRDRWPWWPDALGYFATPIIARADKQRPIDMEELARLNACYVGGFIHLVTRLREGGNGMLQVLYPSSIYVTDPPQGLWEYSLAKAAGEQACALLRGAGVSIHAPRWPLMVTDQSVGILPSQGQQTVQVLTEALTAAFSQVATP